MAKDRRDNTRRPQQVNLAQKAAGRSSAAPQTGKKSPKKKKSNGKKVVTILLVILLIVCVAFLFVVGKMVYDSLATPKKKGPQAVLSSYDTTPKADQDKVAYYLVGLMGKETNAATDRLSIVCFDKRAKTLNILEVPRDTYLGDSGEWAVKRAGDVWANPKPLDWCESCRKQVYAPEIQDGKHTVCKGPITQKTGSATENLIQLFNDQYSLPVDGFFLLEPDTLVKLVDQLGGIDVDLEAAMKVGDINYPKGVQTLDGAAALAYATTRGKDDVATDLALLVKQRKVFGAVLNRLCTTYQGFDGYSESKLAKAMETDTVLARVMGGSAPFRTNLSTAEMAQILGQISNVPLSAVTAWTLPGGAAKSGKDTYYAVHKQELIPLLNESFNPYGNTVKEENLLIAELSSSAKSDTHKQIFSDVVAPQSGKVTKGTAAG